MQTLLLPPNHDKSKVILSMNLLLNNDPPRFKVRVNNLPPELEEELAGYLVSNGVKPERLGRIDFIVSQYEIVEGYILYIHDSLLLKGYTSSEFRTYTNPYEVSADFPRLAMKNVISRFAFEDRVLIYSEYIKDSNNP
jgi:hypothetical protein